MGGLIIQEAKEYGRVLALSGLFGKMSEEAGTLLATHLMLHNMSAYDFKREWHLVKGNPSMRADVMLAKFHELGGKSSIIKRSATEVEIELTKKGDQPKRFSLTWEKAKQEPFIYDGKEEDALAAIASGNTSKLKIKAKYQTEHSRMQMLWARVASDAVRAVAPEVNCGTYTPEEVEDFQGGESRGESPKVVWAPPGYQESAYKLAVEPAPQPAAATILAVAPEGSAEIPREREPPRSTEPATAEQVARAKELLNAEAQRTPNAVQDYKNKLSTNGAGNLRLADLYGWEVQGLIDAIEANKFVDWMADISTIYNRTPF